MAGIELLDFQQEAVERLIAGVVNYFEVGPDRRGGENIPFIGQLKAVTGAGKTPILSSVIGRLGHALVLWTTKYGSVVDQTFTNLGRSGKYSHLLGESAEVLRLSDIPSYSDWRDILEHEKGLTILVSTVAAWNSAQSDDRLNVHRVNPDWGNLTRWDQLRTERKRPLWVVYDEAHNTTTEQLEQLLDLNPAGFFVAGASPLRGKLQHYLTDLPDEKRKQHIVPVSTRAVVDAQLLKSTISLCDYAAPAEQMILDTVKRVATLSQKISHRRATIVPKAIYVVESSNASDRSSEPRPIAIWRTLVNQGGIHPNRIAICTDTRKLPEGAISVPSISQLSERYTHIIFNKKLQEGWDDPAVYVCYFDGKTESATRIQQVIGRALRQPGAQHFDDEDLNTAYFYVHCPNEVVDKIADELREELSIYDTDDSTPGSSGEDYFQVREERKAPQKVSVKKQLDGKLKVPYLQVELADATLLARQIKKGSMEFGDGDRSAPGTAIVTVVSVRTGDVKQKKRNLLEDMRVRCGAYLQEQIRLMSRHCADSIHPDLFNNEKLSKTACYNSPALEHYRDLALKVVAEYENHVELAILADADPNENTYVVKAYQPSGITQRRFQHAAHPHYDSRAFNADELEVAKALDQFNHVWVRNKDRLDYGIPLPIKSGSSSTFYPDFLWWVGNTVWAIDPTGKFILQEKIRTKLLVTPAPLKTALLTRGKYEENYHKRGDDGWTMVRYRAASIRPEVFDTLDDLLKTLEADSDR